MTKIKITFRIIGWIMFLIISVKLSAEFSGLKMFDTVLFSLGGASVGLQGYREVIDIAPWVAGIVYLFAVSINVFSAFKKKDYINVNLINLVLGIMLLIIYAPMLKDYFPLGRVEWHVPALFNFILWAYLSIIIAIIESICLILKKKDKDKYLKQLSE